MIKDLELSEEILGRLAGFIEDLYTAENIVVSGLEVTHVQDEGDCHKAFFCYENAQNRLMRSSVYFTACIGDKVITDFEEVHHEN